MENKKIAIVFAGHPRTFRHTFESHLDFFELEGYEFDYFIHGWSGQWYRGDKTGSSATVDNEIKEDPDSLKNELKKIYKPKGIIIEDQKKCLDLRRDLESLAYLAQRLITKGGGHFGGGKINNWLDATHAGQVYSWQKGTQLKIDYENKTKIKYDGVIKFRLDNILNYHNDNKKQKFLDSICNYERGVFIDRSKSDEYRQRMKFQWQNKPSRDFWHVGDMMFGGPSHVFDILMKDVYIFWLRQYCQVVGNSEGEWVHFGSSEGVLGKKLCFNEIATGAFRVGHFPYREYLISSPDQSYEALSKIRQSADEGGVQKKIK